MGQEHLHIQLVEPPVVSASILTSEPMVLLLLKLKKTSNYMITCCLDRSEKTFRRTTAFYDNKRSMNGAVSLNEDTANSARNSIVKFVIENDDVSR